MKLFIQVKPNSKINRVNKIDGSHFQVQVKAPAKDGKANQATLDLLSDYFDMPKSFFSFVSGQTAKNKIIELRQPTRL